MRGRRGPVRREGGGRFAIRLSDRERNAVRTFTGQLRQLLSSEDPSSDPAVARLFPPALPDDVLANLEFEHEHGDELLRARLEAIDTVERTLDRRHLDEAELDAWLASLNAIRLVVGTRLGVTETSSEKDFEGDEQSVELFELYRYMTWLEGWVIEALDQELASGEPDDRGRGA